MALVRQPTTVQTYTAPLKLLKQNSRNRQDVDNDMRFVLTSTSLRISRVVAQIQAQSSH